MNPKQNITTQQQEQNHNLDGENNNKYEKGIPEFRH